MNLFDLVHHIYLIGGTTTKSDFSRAYASTVGQAASMGLITTETPMDGFGNVWRVSPTGLQALFARKDLEDEGLLIEGEYLVIPTTFN